MISELSVERIGKASWTRAVLKQKLSIKSTNYSLFGVFKPELSILESCCASRYGKGQGCLLTKFWSLEIFRAQGGGKHMNRVQFLELFEPFWFYKGSGSTLRPSTCTYPHWFPNHPQSVPISSCWKATSTRAVLKQNLSIKSKKSLFGGPSNLNCPFWSPAVPNDMDSGKDVWGVYWPKFRVRGQEGGKHMNRVQFLELFDFIEAAFKGTTLNKRTKNKMFFWGEGLPKGTWNNLELVWNHLYLSICLFLFLFLALSIIFIYRLYSHYL